MMNKTKLALGIATVTLTVAGAMVSQQAVAGTRAQHHATESALVSKVDVLEAQLRAMQDEMSAIRAASGQGADSAKVQELDAWMQEHKNQPDRPKDNMVFFRGAYARNDQRPIATTSNGTGGDCLIAGAIGCESSDKDGWAFGAGFDFSLDDNLFGLMNNTEVLAELMFDYNEFGKFQGNVTGVTNGVPGSSSTTTQSQLRLTAAPKIKFLKGSKLRPWIIPAGFTLNVMSPPSQVNTISHLMPAIHFGGGVDYNIWKNIYVGADVRYNWALNKLDGTNVNGFTAGGSLGIGF
ncbi:porin family protein [Methyloglobulus sp.]|uniref:porin family protein n=1 Tax=Methyloglobulus sp. TaxID=2518622 RepID=UPI0032B76A5C